MKFLVRVFLFIFAAAALAACAGEPPQWWDPSGKYSNLNPPQQLSAQPVKTAAQPQPAQIITQPAPAQAEEETFTPVKSAAVEVADLPVPSVLRE
ncbi:MAG: hypothetical protein LBI01_00860 [Elusimicrobium sp.]|nr:hypothetical protein [Elusimicrobium sp.]